MEKSKLEHFQKRLEEMAAELRVAVTDPSGQTDAVKHMASVGGAVDQSPRNALKRSSTPCCA